MKSLQLRYVPFFNHNDPTRMQMASNHLRQAVNLVHSEYPRVKSYDCPTLSGIKAKVVDVLWDGVITQHDDGTYDFIKLDSFLYESYVPYTVHEGYIEPESIAEDGTPLLGVNLLTVVMVFDGYNYEDAIVISESAAKKLAHYSWSKEEIELKDDWSLFPCTDDVDEFGIPKYDIPYVKKGNPYLRICKGSILNIEERIADNDYTLLWDFSIMKATKIPQFNAFCKKWRQRYSKYEKTTHALRQRLVNEEKIVVVKIGQELAKVGDKLANRHGNKGVISIILPDDQMPQTPFGPAEIVINPLGIISRMNIGQLFELHLTKLMYDAVKCNNTDVIHMLQEKVQFDPEKQRALDTISWKDMKQLFKMLGTSPIEEVYNPMSDMTKQASIGWMYWLKLHHLAKNKFSVRQFSGRKGQRFGEMETWTLIAYGADELLYEMFDKLTDSPGKYKLLAQLFGFRIPVEIQQHKSIPAMKFESFMKVLGIDIRKAYENVKES